MVLRDLNYPSLHRTSQSKKIKNAKRKAVAFYNKLMRIAKIECGVGIVKLLLSLTLIVSTIVCFFRTRWAWFLTRWSAFAAAIITLIQYGVFGFSLWTMHQDPIAAEIQFSVPAAAVTGVIVCTIMVAIYFSTWRVLGFSANREIFGA